MIASLHIASVGAGCAPALLRHTPRPGRTPGLVYADLLLIAELHGGLRPRPHPGQVALFAIWQDESALDEFLADDPLASRFNGGRSVRLRPLRARGRWTGIPALAPNEPESSDELDPVAVLTYGRLKLHRAAAFLRTSARAEADAVVAPGLVFGTGFARPPRLVSTFSLWSSAAAMHEFARRGAGHRAALEETARRDFHRESLFLRFRPYALTGAWGGDGGATPAAPAT